MRDLFLLRTDVVYLNHGSFGACPRQVFERYQSWQRKLEHQPVEFFDPERGYREWLAETRRALAEEVGCREDDIVGCTNATHGLNIVARSLPLGPDDEILTTNHEYPALERTWDFVSLRTGAKVVIVDIPFPLTSAEQFNDRVIGAMGERTRVLFLSHVTSPTAQVFPIGEAVAEACRRGIFSVIDGAHAPAHIPLELDELGADFYSGNCHKWMMSPKGAAFLHARREHQPMIDPSIISHGWQRDRRALGPFGRSPFIDAMELQGTRDPAAWLSVPEALRFRRERDWAAISRACSDLAYETAERLANLCGTGPIAPRELCAPQMVSVRIPAEDCLEFQKALRDLCRIEIPVVRWNGSSLIRLSVQCYNTRREMDLLVDALKKLVRAGA